MFMFPRAFIGPPCAVTFSWWGIAYLNDPDTYAGWSFYTPVRATQDRQVEGWRSDKVAAQFLFFFLSYFSPPLLSYYSPIISPFSMLYSSEYNLLALLGLEAPFTHSLSFIGAFM